MKNWLTWLQGIVLLLMAAGLAVLLVGVVAAAHQAPEIHGSGEPEPSLRVLLHHPDSGKRQHPQIQFHALQDLELVRIDDPNQRIPIPAQTRGTLTPRGEDGIELYLIDSATGNNQSIWQTWHVQLRCQDTILPDPHNPEEQLVIPATYQKPSISINYDSGQRQYRGNLEVLSLRDDSCFIINELPIEAYVSGLLQAEMGGSWPLEALKAQAIAGRSFAYSNRLSQRPLSNQITYHLSDSGEDPSYRGSGPISVKIDWAVEETRGQILTWQGHPFAAEFHASSGGHTASYSAIAEQRPNSIFPLQQVMSGRVDPFCFEGAKLLGHLDRYWQRETRLVGADLRNLMLQQGLSDGWVENIRIERDPVSQRALQVSLDLRVLGENTKRLSMSGHRFRHLIGLQRLRSTLWSPESPIRPVMDNNTSQVAWRFISYGYGHGVGLSQVSTFAMAQRGWDAYQIIAFFYDSALVQRRW